jgi:hypothetical protein
MNEADHTYVRNAVYMAMGALKAISRDQDRISEIIRQLQISADKLEGKCEHDWAGERDPTGGLMGTCRKCGETRRNINA